MIKPTKAPYIDKLYPYSIIVMFELQPFLPVYIIFQPSYC